MPEEDGKKMKAIAEIVTMVMRIEQSLINNGKDEIRISKALKRMKKLYREVRRLSNY